MSPNRHSRVRGITVALLLTATSITAAPDRTPTRKALRPELPDHELRKLTPERRALVQDIATQMELDLFYWDTFPVELPPSAFDDGETIQPLLAQDELYQSNGNMELEEVSRGPDGELLHLTEAQLEQVRSDGAFRVPSKRYSGQEHVWEVTTLLQKGQKNIEETAQENRASGLRTLMYSIPARIIGKDPVSMRNGLGHIGYGLWGLGSLLIGLPEMLPRYSPAGLEQKVREDMFRTTLAVLKHDDTRADHTRWIAPDGTVLDLRLYDPWVWQRAYGIVAPLEQQEARDWDLNLASWQLNRERQARDQGVTEEQLPQLLADLAADERQAHLLQLLETDGDLEQLDAGLGALLANQVRAVRHARTAQEAHQRALEQHAAQVSAARHVSNPVKSRIPEWLANEIADALAAYEARERQTPYQQTLAALKQDHLDGHAWLLQKNLEHHRNQAPRLRAALAEMREPSRVFTWDYRIWNPENRPITKNVHTYDDGTTSTSCSTDEYSHVDVTTRWPLWRLGNFTHRTFSWLYNSTYWLLAFNLWSGPVGLKSLFLGDPFLAEMSLNSQTCKMEGDPSSETQTLRSRVGALWTDVRQSREEFEAEPETGFLGKKVSRVLNITWNYGLKGPVGSVLIIGGQPMITLFNVIFTTLAVVTSVFWVPVLSLAVVGLNTLFFDTENPTDDFFSSILPLWAFTLGHIGVAGVGQTGLAALAALVFEPGALVLGGIFTLFTDGGRRLYDALMYRLVIRPLARVPASDSFTARRIKGPGMSSTVYFQLPAQRALLALAARLEKEELDEYNRATTALLNEPVEAYNQFRRQVFGPFTDLGSGLDHASALYRTDSSHRERLGRAVSERDQRLRVLLDIPQRDMIRLVREDLEWTLNEGQRLVRDRYTQHIWAADVERARPEFWAMYKLTANDWEGLTRKLLSDVFSPGILEPLGDEDATLRLTVEHPMWQRYVAAVAQGKGPGDDLKKVHVPRKPVRLAPTATRPLVTVEEAVTQLRLASGSNTDAREAQYRWTPYDVGITLEEMGPVVAIRPMGAEYGMDEFVRSRGFKWPVRRD